MSTMPSEIDLAIKVQQELTRIRIDRWLRDELFKPDWWWLLFLFVTAVFIWWKTMNKARIHEIVLFVVIIMILVIALDELGEELALWDYPYDIIPLFPPMTAINLSCLPLVYSLLYQHFRNWKGFTIASFVMSLSFCFILEPLFELAGVYQHLQWKHIYGFPIYIAIGLAAKAAVSAIQSIVKKREQGLNHLS